MSEKRASTINPAEAEHFGRLAADWWDPNGSSAMLHRLNPVRLRYLRERIDRHFGADEHDRQPLAGRRAADVGCGAGLLTEPLARMGADVTGIDAAQENIEAARVHALGQGLDIDYRVGGTEALTGPYELITAMEVVEHVADVALFIDGLADSLAPGGLLAMSTPNRTATSRALLVGAAEALGRIPRGTHDWDKFLTPDELRAVLESAGLQVLDVTGLGWSPGRGLRLTRDTSLNYLLTAVRRA
jgi:2-polyprenyl-6-hydroxyphenyl methylase/3-demethylubiquinone-9 3-methyltransferase